MANTKPAITQADLNTIGNLVDVMDQFGEKVAKSNKFLTQEEKIREMVRKKTIGFSDALVIATHNQHLEYEEWKDKKKEYIKFKKLYAPILKKQGMSADLLKLDKEMKVLTKTYKSQNNIFKRVSARFAEFGKNISGYIKGLFAPVRSMFNEVFGDIMKDLQPFVDSFKSALGILWKGLKFSGKKIMEFYSSRKSGKIGDESAEERKQTSLLRRIRDYLKPRRAAQTEIRSITQGGTYDHAPRKRGVTSILGGLFRRKEGTATEDKKEDGLFGGLLGGLLKGVGGLGSALATALGGMGIGALLLKGITGGIGSVLLKSLGAGALGFGISKLLGSDTETAIQDGVAAAILPVIVSVFGGLPAIVAAGLYAAWKVSKPGRENIANRMVENQQVEKGGALGYLGEAPAFGDPFGTRKGRSGVEMGDATLAGVNPTLAERFSKMQSDLGSQIPISSGYRSMSEQAKLYANPGKYPVAKPGNSMHNYGMAIDVPESVGNKLDASGALAAHGLFRPWPVKDPVHIQMVGTSLATARAGGAGGADINSIISEASAKYGVPEALIRGIIKRESNFRYDAVSGAGAKGLMQLMPGTAAEMGVTNPFDPRQNVMGGTKYIAQQLKSFGGNVDLALAAYNAGPGNVRKYGGIPPFAETQHYVQAVKANMGAKGTLTGGGTSYASITGGAGTTGGFTGILSSLANFLSQSIDETALSAKEAGSVGISGGDATSAIRGAESNLTMTSNVGDASPTVAPSSSISGGDSSTNVAVGGAGGKQGNQIPEPQSTILGSAPLMWLVYNNAT